MCMCSLSWEATKIPKKIFHASPGCPPQRSKSNSTNDDCGVRKAATVKKCHRFEEKKKGSRCWRCWGRIWESRSIHSSFFFGEKRDESLLKLLEHVGKNAWMTYEIYGNMTKWLPELDWMLVKMNLFDPIAIYSFRLFFPIPTPKLDLEP